MEWIELVVVIVALSIILAILLYSPIFWAQVGAVGYSTGLSAKAQNVLETILQSPGYPEEWYAENPPQSFGLASAELPNELDPLKLQALAYLTTYGNECKVVNNYLKSLVGDRVLRTGVAALAPAEVYSARLNYSYVKGLLFGEEADLYEFVLRLKPVLEARICLPEEFEGLVVVPYGCFVEGSSAVLKVSNAFGRPTWFEAMAYFVYYSEEVALVKAVQVSGMGEGYIDVEGLTGLTLGEVVESIRSGNASMAIVAYVNSGGVHTTAYVFVVASDLPLVYLLPILTEGSTRLYVTHEQAVECFQPPGLVPALGLRYVTVLQSDSFFKIPINAKINPSRGQKEFVECGEEEVAKGGCYVDFPKTAMFVVVEVERSSEGVAHGVPKSAVYVMPIGLSLRAHSSLEFGRRGISPMFKAVKPASARFEDYLVELELYRLAVYGQR